MSRPTPTIYQTTNWPAHNEALKRRGSLTIWFDPEMTWDAAPTGRRGRQQTYCDAAIQTCLSMMHCLKFLGQRLMARDFERQVAELQVRIAILNGYNALGIPVTKIVG